MTTPSPSEISKATRGTKRVCQACEVRFYDLSRDPIVCPSCGAQFAPVATRAAELATRKAPYVSKRGWGDRTGARPPEAARDEPVTNGAAEPAEDAREELEASEAESEIEAPGQDETVLEPELDEPDVSGLVDHIDEPKEP
jgi:uncharacterized protein (TIGR02300 family)